MDIRSQKILDDEKNKKSPSDILKDSADLFERGLKKEACILISLSIRKFVSEKYGAGDEITDNECLMLINRKNKLYESCGDILEKTAEVRFTGTCEDDIDNIRFKGFLDKAQDIISEK